MINHTLAEVRDERDELICSERGFAIESNPSLPEQIERAIVSALLESQLMPLGVGVGATSSVVLSASWGQTVEVRWTRTS